MIAFLGGFLILIAVAPAGGQVSSNYEGPVGVTGIFNGNVTTACSYDPLNHSAHRPIDDIVVPGSIGKYPLKMTRYFNSRRQYYVGQPALSPGWGHEYSWLQGSGYVPALISPQGNVSDFLCGGPVGVSEYWEDAYTWRLADGGRVHFNTTTGRCDYIDDPYGLRTTIEYSNNRTWRVTEPGGRCLIFTYGPAQDRDGTVMLTRVEAYDHYNGNLIDWVNYTYHEYDPIYPQTQPPRPPKMMLTGVTYSDGSSATYDYRTDNVHEDQTSHKMYPLLETASDVRYNGPMHTIRYEYQGAGPHGAIIDEKYPGVGAVSAIAPGVPTGGAGTIDTFTETRGDGPTRTFNYTHISHCQGIECGPCDDYVNNNPPQQMLTSYTDFQGIQGHTTWLGYDTNTWYVTSVTDARGSGPGDLNYTTNYTRGPDIGQITQIKHPDTTHIDYTYQPEPGAIGGHYVQTVSNERQYVTTYQRDGTTHEIYEIDYPDSGDYETFSRNNFGQVLNHRLRNGAWERFAYDGRGLLTDKWNPKQTLPADGDPHTHYTYYTSGPWTDRVQTMTPPANVCHNVASETYEYDRDNSRNAVPGRGLVTKITHADGTYQSFGYDIYGNKLWEENELPKRTSYTYDDYNRVLTVKDPIGQTTGRTTAYTYTPTNGNGTNSYLHTTNNPDTITTPTGIVTKNIYDQNFRKTSSIAAYLVLNLTTWFHYDPVGNQDYVTDPRGTGLGDSAYTTYTDYDARNRKSQVREPLGRTTQFYYEDGINVTRIVRPDTTNDWKTYDALNRMIAETVRQTSSIYLNTYIDYNPSGTIQKVTDPNGHHTWFYYDASDQKTQMTYDDGISTQRWAYDDAHNLANRTTVAGGTQIQRFCYDNRNRKIGMTWDNTAAEWANYSYYDDGRLWTASNANSTVTRQYDDAGRLTLDRQNIAGFGIKNVNYPTYDDDGRLTRMYVTNQDGSAAGYDYTFSYDAMGRFEKIFGTGQGSPWFQYYYDAASNEIRRDNLYLNPVVTQTYPRDALDRIQYVDVTNGSTLGHEAYTYDPMNRIYLVDYGNGHSDSFGYYLDGELNQAQLGNLNRNITYNLDQAGNRTSVVDTGVTKNYAPNNLNQYTTGESLGVTNGSEHQIQSFNKVNYNYINDERLAQASDGTNTYSLFYDALGRCVKRTLTVASGTSPLTNPVTTYYVYDGEKPILEYDANTGILVGLNLYGKGIDEILERGAYGADNLAHIYFFQQNHEGSVSHLIDASGNVIELYRYDVFGAPTIYDRNWNVRQFTTYDNRFLFTGREYAATYRSIYNVQSFTFYEYRARAYNPQLGRFMSEDPKLFDAGDYNLFRYCHNDPVDLIDPMGLTDIDISPQMYGQIWQASVNSYNAYKAAGDGIGRSQLVIQRDGQGNMVRGTFLQTNRDGSPTINKSNIVAVPREEYKQYHTGQPYRYVEQETGDAGKGFRAAASGHVHADKTGHGMPQWSDTDKNAARGTNDHPGRPVGKINESNPGVMKVLVPQKEGGEPRDRTFTASDIEKMIRQGTDEAHDKASQMIYGLDRKNR